MTHKANSSQLYMTEIHYEKIWMNKRSKKKWSAESGLDFQYSF